MKLAPAGSSGACQGIALLFGRVEAMSRGRGAGSGGRDPQENATTSPEGEERPQTNVEAERASLQERISNWLDLPLAILALIWTGLLVVELAFAPPPDVSERIILVDFAIWAIFAMVFLLELAIAPDKLRYLENNILAALAVVLPLVRAVRIFRFVMVLRTFSLVRIVLVGNRATRAAAEIFSENRFGYVLILVLITVLLGSAGAYFFEIGAPNAQITSFGDALWWASTLITTMNVGVEPVTVEGRIIGLIIRVVALAVLGYVTASIASFLIERRVGLQERQRADRAALEEMTREVGRLRREVARLRTEFRDSVDGAPGKEQDE